MHLPLVGAVHFVVLLSATVRSSGAGKFKPMRGQERLCFTHIHAWCSVWAKNAARRIDAEQETLFTMRVVPISQREGEKGGALDENSRIQIESQPRRRRRRSSPQVACATICKLVARRGGYSIASFCIRSIIQSTFRYICNTGGP